MRDVAIVGFAQTPSVRAEDQRNEVEMLTSILPGAIAASGVPRERIGFTCSGSSDLLCGQPFSFVAALDAVGAWPPIAESHVEMDGAWALYEAWVRMQHDDVDAALVYAFGKSSQGPVDQVLAMQLDPYYLAPLWPGANALAAMQARAWLEAGGHDERELATVAARARRSALGNPNAQVKGEVDVDELLAAPYVASPLRAHDCPPVSDGAAVVILAAGDLAREVCARPAWIRGLDHRIEPHSLGARDLTRSPSTARAAEALGLAAGEALDVVELAAPYTHQQRILCEALGIEDDERVNPSGGALTANPIMVTGLIRLGEVATRLTAGAGKRGARPRVIGPCLQQNLLCLMETD